jgi:hypothetical protein
MSDSLISALIGALSGAVIAAVGWTIASWQAERARRRKAAWNYLKRQLGELYAPLEGLLADVEQHFQALARTPAEVLRHLGSPFAPDKDHDAPLSLAQAA